MLVWISLTKASCNLIQPIRWDIFQSIPKLSSGEYFLCRLDLIFQSKILWFILLNRKEMRMFVDSRHHQIEITARLNTVQKGCLPFRFQFITGKYRLLLHDTGHDQKLLCAGQRHIQDAQFLTHILTPDIRCHHLFEQCGTFSMFVPFYKRQSDPVIHIENNGILAVLLIDLMMHSCCKYNRKFQSLTFMDTHDAHYIRIFAQSVRLSEIHLIPLQLVDITDKMKQSAIACGLICGRLRQQHLQIRFSFFSIRPRTDIGKISSLTKQLIDQIVHRQFPFALSKIVQPQQKRLYLFCQRIVFFPLFVCTQIFIQKAAFHFIGSPKDRQLLIGKAPYRRQQRGSQRYVLQRIVDHLQKRQHGLYLQRAKIPRLGYFECRHTAFCQLLYKLFAIASRTAQQNHDVRVPKGSGGTIFLRHLHGLLQFPDLQCDESGLQLFRILYLCRLHSFLI